MHPHRPALQAGASLFGHAVDLFSLALRSSLYSPRSTLYALLRYGVTCGSRTRSSSATSSRAPGTLRPPSFSPEPGVPSPESLHGQRTLAVVLKTEHSGRSTGRTWSEREESNLHRLRIRQLCSPLHHAPLVGMAGIEPAASWFQARRSATEPHPVWSERPESNRRDPGPEPGASPLRYAPNFSLGRPGVEPGPRAYKAR